MRIRALDKRNHFTALEDLAFLLLCHRKLCNDARGLERATFRLEKRRSRRVSMKPLASGCSPFTRAGIRTEIAAPGFEPGAFPMRILNHALDHSAKPALPGLGGLLV